MQTAFAVMAIVSFLLVIPIAGMTDSYRRGTRESGLLFFGAVLVALTVGVVGWIATAAN